MIPPVFSVLSTDSYLSAFLGAAPFRCYPFGTVPQNTEKPYMTYYVYSGNPVNTLSTLPDQDMLGTQIDIWSDTVGTCTQIAQIARDLLEPYGHMSSFSSESKDKDTGLFRLIMSFDFYTSR